MIETPSPTPDTSPPSSKPRSRGSQPAAKTKRVRPACAPAAPGPFVPAAVERAAQEKAANPEPAKKADTSANSEAPAKAGPLAFDHEDILLKRIRDGVAYNQERGDYWRKTERGDYVKTSETDLKRHLRRGGYDLSSFVDVQFTRFDNAVCYAQEHSAVACVFDLAGHKAGLFNAANGRRVLVPNGVRLIAPAKGSIENWIRLHEELFGPEQFHRVLSWTKCALEDYYGTNPARWRHSQMLCLTGPTNCGKSYWQRLLTLLFNTGSADPWLLFTGNDSGKFTKDLAESPHWLIQDKKPFGNLAARASFTANAKAHLVTSDLDVHGKGKDKVTLPTFRRVTLSTNDDADFLTLIPNLEESMRDKLLIVKCAQATMLPDFLENEARFVAERAAWLHFLLHEYSIPKELADVRMGVRAWCNPQIEEQLCEFDPVARFLECVDNVFFGDGVATSVRLTVTEIQARLVGDSKFGAVARQMLTGVNVTGQYLARLHKQHPQRFTPKIVRGVKSWVILSGRDISIPG